MRVFREAMLCRRKKEKKTIIYKNEKEGCTKRETNNGQVLLKKHTCSSPFPIFCSPSLPPPPKAVSLR